MSTLEVTSSVLSGIAPARGTDAAHGVIARGLGKRYGPSVVLEDVSFALAPGEMLAVVGPDGAGKTTLVQLLAGLLEATEVALSSELGGRLSARPTREGDRVRRGDLLAEFDVELLEHDLRVAPDIASRAHLELQRERQRLRSPLDGWVVQALFEPGEHVLPGVPVVVVADWRELTLKVYLPEDTFGRVALGQAAAITVDAYPGEAFAGQVTFIASQAEFTPRNVQTREDRVKSVYVIKLRVPNADLRLKPGMFADAIFAAEPIVQRD